MTYSFVLLRLVVMPFLVGIVAAGMTEMYKRNRIVPAALKKPWPLHFVTAFYCILGSYICLVVWHEQQILMWLTASLPVDYGIAVVIYTHLFKPINNVCK